MIQNIGEMTINAMFYIYFVALSGGLGLVTAGFVGFKLYKRSVAKAAKKATTTKHKKMRLGA